LNTAFAFGELLRADLGEVVQGLAGLQVDGGGELLRADLGEVVQGLAGLQVGGGWSSLEPTLERLYME